MVNRQGRAAGWSQLRAWLRLWPWLPGMALAVFAFALAARLLPVLRGGGLLGLDTYDDGVHYASALALVDGRLPYRDFLFLHPPGIVAALAPFAAFGSLTHDGWGFAAGRVAWMLTGSMTAAVIVVALRQVGWLGALVGGVGYAIYLPVLRVERTTMLEGLTSFMLAIALGLLGTTRLRVRHPWCIYLSVGVLLGIASGVKIWGVVVVIVVAGWVAVAHGVGKALRVALGALIGVTAVCLPFFSAAPTAMWRMVVLDQLQRPDNGIPLLYRLAAIVGLPDDSPPDGPAVTAAIVALAALVLIASTAPARLMAVPRHSSEPTLSGPRSASAASSIAPGYGHPLGPTEHPTRRRGPSINLRVQTLSPLLTLATGAVILLSRSFYPHYPASMAVPMALSVGTAAAAIRAWTGAHAVWAPRLVTAASIAVLLVLASPVTQLRVGERLPVSALSRELDRPGCVTSDDASILVAFDVFSRNLQRGCRVVVDMTGYSYDISPGLAGSRTHNPAFQSLALDYLSSGDVTAAWRLREGWGYSHRTVAEIQRWPILSTVGTYVVRQPKPEQRSATLPTSTGTSHHPRQREPHSLPGHGSR